MKSGNIVLAGLLALVVSTRAAVALAQPPAATSAPTAPAAPVEGPDQLALFKDLKIDAVADKLIAGCKARNFKATRADTRVTCTSTRLGLPDTGAFIAKAGEDIPATYIDTFIFVVAPVGVDSAVLEKSYRVRGNIKGTPPALTEHDKQVAADIKIRVGKFLTEMGGILQALPPPKA